MLLLFKKLSKLVKFAIIFNNLHLLYIQTHVSWGIQVAESVKPQALDLSSILDLRVGSSSPALGSKLGTETTKRNF